MYASPIAVPAPHRASVQPGFDPKVIPVAAIRAGALQDELLRAQGTARWHPVAEETLGFLTSPQGLVLSSDLARSLVDTLEATRKTTEAAERTAPAPVCFHDPSLPPEATYEPTRLVRRRPFSSLAN